MAKNNNAQPINGILLVNKPAGLTSNTLLQKVKRLYNAKKAGHTGSLDPMATGMLPICFGEATKFCQYLLDQDKTYQATGLLGIKTTTGDAMGDVIAEAEKIAIDESQLKATIDSFSGVSLQTPSMFSALKHHGVPLYKYARQGKVIERNARPIHIKDIALTAFDGRYFDITVTCSKGTYIRNLIEDIGENLRVGAHVTRLHRVSTEAYFDKIMYNLDELLAFAPLQLQQCLLPMDSAVTSLDKLVLDDQQLSDLRFGKIIQLSQASPAASIRLYDQADRFAGLGTVDAEGWLKVKRLLSHSMLSVV